MKVEELILELQSYPGELEVLMSPSSRLVADQMEPELGRVTPALDADGNRAVCLWPAAEYRPEPVGYGNCDGCGNPLSEGEMFRGEVCDSCKLDEVF